MVVTLEFLLVVLRILKLCLAWHVLALFHLTLVLPENINK